MEECLSLVLAFVSRLKVTIVPSRCPDTIDYPSGDALIETTKDSVP
jgi:hypothetical protein